MAWRNYKNNTVAWFDSIGKTELNRGQSYDNITYITQIRGTRQDQRIKFESNMKSNASIVINYEDGTNEFVQFDGKDYILHQLLSPMLNLTASGLQNDEVIKLIIYPYCVKIDAKSFVDGKEGTASSLSQLLSVIKREIWYRVSYGLPLYEKITTKVQMDSVVLTIINNHSEIVSISDFTSSISGHSYSAKVNAVSIYGPIQIVI